MGNILSVGGLLGGLTACLTAVSLGEWRGEERRGGLSPYRLSVVQTHLLQALL